MSYQRFPRRLLTPCLASSLLAALAHAQGAVSSEQKISSFLGGFPTGELEAGDQFGAALAQIGDLDNDGVPDLAIGAIGDDDGDVSSFLFGRGAVWIVFQNADGTVKGTQKISATQGGFTGTISMQDFFGNAVAALGDLDNDGNPDLAVGVSGDDQGGTDRGAVHVLFLNANGTVKARQEISDVAGGLVGTLDDGDAFGSSLAGLGDVDGDGNPDLAVGAQGDDDGATNAGAVYVLFLGANGMVLGEQKISATAGGFVGPLADGDRFGRAVAGAGDFDGDGVEDLAVGADRADGGGTERGSVWLLFLDASGSVLSEVGIDSTEVLGVENNDAFGGALAFMDNNNDGRSELVVGAPRDDDGGTDRGAVWLLSLNADGSFASSGKISSTVGSLVGPLDNGDLFGGAIADLGLLDAGNLEDLGVGTSLDDDGGSASGAIWTLFLGLKGSSVVRNGLGGNPLGFVETKAAVIGSTWDTTVDIATPAAVASAVAVSSTGPTQGTVLSGFLTGEVLILAPFAVVDVATGVHSLALPPDPGLVGQFLATQAATLKAMDVRFQNALDVTVGSS